MANERRAIMKKSRYLVYCATLIWTVSSGLLAQTHQHQEQASQNPASNQGHAAKPMPGMKMPEQQQPKQPMPGMNMPPQQPQQMPEMKMAKPEQQPTLPLLTLEQLEQMALANNPTLAQASAEVQAAAGRTLQAGLYPNPTVGYEGEEIRGGSFRGGQQGFFVQQDIVLGGKLGLSRKVFQQEQKQAETEKEEQRLRVLNGVRVFYVQALAAQETLDLRRKLNQITQDALLTSQQLFNIGQSDQPDVLQAQVEAEQAELAVIAAEQNQQRVWRALAATVGNPSLPLSRLEGSLEDIPDINPEQWLHTILKDSPAVKIAQLGIDRAQAALARAQREPVPDLQFRGGLEQNRELNEITNRPVGAQGFAEVGVRIPIFNRNQGNVEAAKADLERSKQETRRIELLLRERAAALFQNYVTSRAAVERYKNRMIPQAEKAYKLYLQKYSNMTAAYPQVLVSQRTFFQLQADYIVALENLWINSVAIKGFLLSDGLEAPSKPGDIERSIREINVPSTSATMTQR